MKAIPPPGNRDLLSAGQVADLLGCTKRTVWKLLSSGKFPKPVRLTPKLPRWRRADLDKYISSLAEAKK